jgi:adenylate cyclase
LSGDYQGDLMSDESAKGRAAEPHEVGPGLGSGQVERRLSAFLALDIKSYSVLISDDEARVHRRVGRDLAVVVRAIHKHSGRVVHFAGDGLLAEFVSSGATLQSALDIQSAAAKRNRRRPIEGRIEYRIGINTGDIVVQSGRIGGDTINIAARLEQIAEPGGICISEAVFSQVRQTVKANYTNIGAVRLRNIRYPIRTYRVSPPRSRRGLVDVPDGNDVQPAGIQDYRPSVAILPFDNLSGDADSDYFSDGLVEDIIVSLAGLRELRVISRASTLSYLSGRTDVREVGQRLGVRYVVSGSIRRSAQSIRAAVELTDVQTGFSLWADSSQFPPGDLFEMQDRLVGRIVTRIAPHIREEELRRALRQRPDNMTAYDRLLQALHLMDYLEKDIFAQAKDMLNQAMKDDPHFAMPVAWSVWWHIIWVGQGWSNNPQEDYAAARDLADRAIALDPNNALGLAMTAHLHSFLLHDYEAALVFFARALEAGSGNPIVVIMYAVTLAYLGRGEEAVRHATHAISLSPLDHKIFLFHCILAWAHFAVGSYADAAKWARASDYASPRFTANLRILIASLAAVGANQEARAAALRLLELEPDFALGRYEQTLLPYRESELRTRLLSCLRSAGLPD